MNIVAMVALAALILAEKTSILAEKTPILAEKTSPRTESIARLAGVPLGLAIATIWVPWLAPGSNRLTR